MASAETKRLFLSATMCFFYLSINCVVSLFWLGVRNLGSAPVAVSPCMKVLIFKFLWRNSHVIFKNITLAVRAVFACAFQCHLASIRAGIVAAATYYFPGTARRRIAHGRAAKSRASESQPHHDRYRIVGYAEAANRGSA